MNRFRPDASTGGTAGEIAEKRRRLAERVARDPAKSLRYHSRISLSRRYVCMTVPKVACTTIKFALQQLEFGDRADPRGVELIHQAAYSGQVHQSGARLAQLEPDEILEALSSPDWFRFCLVRNPYHRVFSAYKSKMINPQDEEYAWLRKEIRQTCGYPRGDGQPPRVAFRDFVRYLANTDNPSVRYDGHLDTQSRILMWDVVEYDFVGRFERFATDFAQVLRRIGAPNEILSIAELTTNPTPSLSHAAVYDHDLAALVYTIYEADFVNLGYEPDSWMYD